ncbi:serine hydrolase [Mucilaginibacter sp. OK283]|jgi:CubicO group peptidase (beta-lactamase class C family)|uniref:serine hydrolase n=1 Tax=Mucilaginibacter sp. OK283 TaxID=1881049 RepID=UPI0008B77E1B|nr:serine hydrolase [Mucilaginibacter sp. OK283]SEP27137.1 CubicO group peptidase, beta-lactamase class C family [Mucilaginibacter sp. OK283]
MKLLKCLLFICLAPAIAFAQTNPNIQEFDNYVQQAVTDWHVPGLAIAIVKDGKVVFTKGYGVRELGKPDKVDTQTIFAIASTTKAMTAACAAMLVDEGKLHWDDKVTDYLPGFQLNDPYVTRELTVRDLFLHDTGVGNTDYLWAYMNIPADDMLRRLRLVKPEYGFRAGFVYQNLFYVTAGKVIEKASGMPWQDFVQKRIFTPLKMIRSVPTFSKIKGVPNQSSAHIKVDSSIVVAQKDVTDAISPAGGVWSSVEDMAKWVNCMLDSTKYSGSQRLLKPESWAMLLKPQTFVPESEFYPTARVTKPHWITYGLGWFQQDYQGQKVDFHTGSLTGLVAINGMIVDKKVGVYILANLDHAELRHALMFKAFDFFALGGNRDWSKEFLALYGDILAKRQKSTKEYEAKRVMGTHPTLDLKAYAGTYSDPLYGTVVITATADKLTFNINNFITAEATCWNYDTFVGSYARKEYGKIGATFNIDELGKVSTVNVDGMLLARQ